MLQIQEIGKNELKVLSTLVGKSITIQTKNNQDLSFLIEYINKRKQIDRFEVFLVWHITQVKVSPFPLEELDWWCKLFITKDIEEVGIAYFTYIYGGDITEEIAKYMNWKEYGKNKIEKHINIGGYYGFFLY